MSFVAVRLISSPRSQVEHIARSRMVALCGWTSRAVYTPVFLQGHSQICPKCYAIANPAAPEPTLPPPDGSVILGRWEIELEGSPPRHNEIARGSFTASREQIMRQRMAIQGKQKSWKKRAGILLLEAGVPVNLGFVRVSSVYYRANPASGDEDGDLDALKAITDAIVAHGCVPDDSRRYMRREVPESRKRPPDRRKNSVRIIIEQLGRRST